MEKHVVTISREYGSGGREIGRKLAESLDVPFYDREKIDIIAAGKEYSKELIAQSEMKAKNGFLYNLSAALGGTGFDGLGLNEKTFLAQFDAIKKIAEEGPCVIVGRCADYVLRDVPGTTNIFIYSELEKRIDRVVNEYGIPADEARGWVSISDKARANYYHHHTGRRWGEAVNYNMSIDSGYISQDNIVKLIKEYMELKEKV